MDSAESTARLPVYARGGVIVAHAIVDAADYEWASAYRWNLGRKGYVRRSERIKGSGNPGRKKGHSLHREVIGARAGELIDHIDQDKLNNRRSNLRVADNFASRLNCGIRSNNRSGYRGVAFYEGNSPNLRYVASIGVGNGVQKTIGRFPSAEDAARAYDHFARIYHGGHAMLNLPEEEDVLPPSGLGKTVRRDSASGYRGVYLDKRSYKCEVNIKKDGNRFFIGRYDTPEEAARAYDAAARHYHGERAVLNFPEEDYGS